MTDAPDPANASAEGSYTLRIVFAGLILLHHPVADTFWALFFQPESTVWEQTDLDKAEKRAVPKHVTRIFAKPELTSGTTQQAVSPGSPLDPFVGKEFIQVEGQHLTIEAASSQTVVELLEVTEGNDSAKQSNYSWVASIPELLAKQGWQASLKPELTDDAYPGNDLIARLHLDKGKVSTHRLWTKGDGKPSTFTFDDNLREGKPHLAREVAVELEVSGEVRLMGRPLAAREGDAAPDTLQTLRAAPGEVVELSFVTAKAPDADPNHQGNHFLSFYKLFRGNRDLQDLRPFPVPFAVDGIQDTDGACTVVNSGP